MPVFWPASGGYGRPIGRGSGTGVNFSTRFPYPLGASSKGEGGTNFWGAGEGVGFVVDVGFGAAFSASLARRRYDVLKERHWQSRHKSFCLRGNDMIRSSNQIGRTNS